MTCSPTWSRRPEQTDHHARVPAHRLPARQATLVGVARQRRARRRRDGRGDRPRRRGRVRPGRDRPEDLGGARSRARRAGRGPPRAGGGGRRPAAVGRPGADRPDQRGAARQGAEARPVRLLRRRAARRRRDRRRGGRHRGGGAGAHRVDHRRSATRSCARSWSRGPTWSPSRPQFRVGRRDGGVPPQRLQPHAGVRRGARRRRSGWPTPRT